MVAKYVTLAVLIALALISDTKSYKIKNIVNLIFIMLGLALNFYYGGLRGTATAIFSVIIPIFILLPLFALRMLGAGDIKLLASIGAIIGLEFTIGAMLYSFICGGFIAFILILVRKNAMQRFKYLANYLMCCFLTLSLQPYTDFRDKSDGAKFRFSYAIACGTIVKFIMDTRIPV